MFILLLLLPKFARGERESDLAVDRGDRAVLGVVGGRGDANSKYVWVIDTVWGGWEISIYIR